MWRRSGSRRRRRVAAAPRLPNGSTEGARSRLARGSTRCGTRCVPFCVEPPSMPSPLVAEIVRYVALLPTAAGGDDGGMRRVVIVAFPGVQTLDVTGPAEVLRAATKLHPPGYEVTVAAPEEGPLRTSTVTIVPDLPLSACRFPIDTLIVAGGTGTRRGRGGRGADRVAPRGREALAARDLRLHRRLPARQGRPARRPSRHHPLGVVRRTWPSAIRRWRSSRIRSSCATATSPPRRA